MDAGLQIRLALRRPGFALDLDLALPGRGITALFGPSGCGQDQLPARHRGAGPG